MYQILKSFQFLGLDLTSNDKTRPEGFASEWINGDVTLTGISSKRKGSQIKASSDGGFGLISFRRVNPITRQEEDELLSIGEDLLRYSEASMVVTYSGSAVVVTANLLLENGIFYFRIVADGVSLCNVNLGTGLEAAPVSIATLTSTVDALANITATATGSTSVSAAFLDLSEDHDLKAGPLTVKAASFSVIPFRSENSADNPKPFTRGTHYYQGTDEFINPTYVQLHDCLYIASNKLFKYDGQSVHYAGMPASNYVAPVTAQGGAAVGAGTYLFKFRVVHVDNAGNRIVGDWSTTQSITLAGAQHFKIRQSSFASDFAGVRGALVNGLQSGVSTVTVDSNHDLVAGDRIYFYDSASSQFVEAVVTATTATTLALAGMFDGLSVWDFADNCVISTHRVEVCRTQAGGTSVFYLVDEIPIDTKDLNIFYFSTRANGAELAEITEPAYPPTEPPECKYVTKWQNTLVVGGQFYTASLLDSAVDRDRVGSTIQWADIEFFEGFPSTHSLEIDAQSGDKISGLAENNESLIIGKDKSIHRASGDLGLLQVTTEAVVSSNGEKVGVASHHSMKEIDGRLLFLSHKGVRSMVSGQKPDGEIGYKIESAFKIDPTPGIDTLELSRAVALVYDQKYILFVPAEGGTATPSFVVPGLNLGDGGGTITPDQTVYYLYTNSNSRCFVFDSFRGAWREWRGLDMSGGACVHDGRLWRQSRTYSTPHTAVKYWVSKELITNSKRDFNDHATPISWRYATGFVHLGQPAVDKQFIELRVEGKIETTGNDFDLTVSQEADFVRGVQKMTATLDCNEDPTYGINAQLKLYPGKMRSTRLILENSAGSTNVEIEGLELEVAAPFKEELAR